MLTDFGRSTIDLILLTGSVIKLASMKLQSFFPVILIFLISVNESWSQAKDYPNVTIGNTEVRTIRSEYVEDMEYYIHVAFPSDYEGSDKNYPVVYYTDAFYHSGMVIETYRYLRAFNEIPPMILVGISYDVNETKHLTLRARDFTPTHIPPEKLPEWLQPFTQASGGAENFLNFLEYELIPTIESHYRVDPSNRGLLGYSYGGLFSGYVLFKKPDLFNHYFIGAPALFWDDDYVFELEEKLASERKTVPVKVFTAIGSEDGLDLMTSWIKLRDRLNYRKYEGLEFSYLMIDGENHTSAVPAVFSRAFRVLYGKN